jgi:hypothetical protein
LFKHKDASKNPATPIKQASPEGSDATRCDVASALVGKGYDEQKEMLSPGKGSDGSPVQLSGQFGVIKANNPVVQRKPWYDFPVSIKVNVLATHLGALGLSLEKLGADGRYAAQKSSDTFAFTRQLGSALNKAGTAGTVVTDGVALGDAAGRASLAYQRGDMAEFDEIMRGDFADASANAAKDLALIYISPTPLGLALNVLNAAFTTVNPNWFADTIQGDLSWAEGSLGSSISEGLVHLRSSGTGLGPDYSNYGAFESEFIRNFNQDPANVKYPQPLMAFMKWTHHWPTLLITQSNNASLAHNMARWCLAFDYFRDNLRNAMHSMGWGFRVQDGKRNNVYSMSKFEDNPTVKNDIAGFSTFPPTQFDRDIWRVKDETGGSPFEFQIPSGDFTDAGDQKMSRKTLVIDKLVVSSYRPNPTLINVEQLEYRLSSSTQRKSDFLTGLLKSDGALDSATRERLEKVIYRMAAVGQDIRIEAMSAYVK